MPHAARKALTDQLHISYSQISTYLACSLKHQFRYVLGLSPERIGLALPFGSALHKAIERYYRALGQGIVEKAETLRAFLGDPDRRAGRQRPVDRLFKRDPG